MVPANSLSLPSVRELILVHLSSENYHGLVSLLTGIKQIDVTLSHPNSDLSALVQGLNRVGQDVTRMRLNCGWSNDKRTVSAYTMMKLCDVIEGKTKRLEEVRLGHLAIDEESLVSLVEACRMNHTMRTIT